MSRSLLTQGSRHLPTWLIFDVINMKKSITLVIHLVFSTATLLIADIVGYTDAVRIWSESESLVAIHDHDWSKANIDNPNKLDLPFSEGNDCAYVEIWDKNDGVRLWRTPSPAFTYLWISPDEKYIVGMSDIKIGNPYQLVIFSHKGDILVREHVVPLKAVLTPDELEAFWEKYPGVKQHLTPRIKLIDGKIYVDFMVMNLSKLISKDAWTDLYKKSVQNPEFPFVAESTSNWVKWYFHKPDLSIQTKDGKRFLEFTSLSFDIENSDFAAGVRVGIKIPDNPIFLDHDLKANPMTSAIKYLGDRNSSPRIVEYRGETFLEFNTHLRSSTSNGDPFADPFGGPFLEDKAAETLRFKVRKEQKDR